MRDALAPPRDAWAARESSARAGGDSEGAGWRGSERRGPRTHHGSSSRGGSPSARRPDSAASGPAYRTTGPLARTVGREVHHETFGRGVVVMAEGEGGEVKFTVRFGTVIREVLGRFLTVGDDVDQP